MDMYLCRSTYPIVLHIHYKEKTWYKIGFLLSDPKHILHCNRHIYINSLNQSDLNFHYSSYSQTSIANVEFVNNRSLQYTCLRTVMHRFVYVTLYVYVMCLIETSLFTRISRITCVFFGVYSTELTYKQGSHNSPDPRSVTFGTCVCYNCKDVCKE